MPDLNDPLKDSYIGQVADALKPYTAELTAAGFDPTSRITQLAGAGELIQNAAKARESAEKAASDAIKNEQAIRSQFYKLSTDTVSLVEGLVSKDHPLTQRLRGMRADLIGKQNVGGGGTTPPTPAPPSK